MAATLLLQTSRWRDVTDDAALTAAAGALDPIQVLAATAEPARTGRATGLTTVPAHLASVLRILPLVDSVVVLGGRPLSSSAREGHLLSLAGLFGLMAAVRVTGKRFALIGVGADRIVGFRDSFFTRRLVRRSSFTALDTAQSVGTLAAVGLPLPMRVAADLAWLQLQEPPEPAAGGTEVWCPLTSLDVDAHHGAEATASVLAEVATAAAGPQRIDRAVAVQAWRSGALAGKDLEATNSVATGLRRLGVQARVVSPPNSLAEERDLLRSARLCVCIDPHTLMAASAAGIPLLAWPHDLVGEAAAQRLEVPILTADPGAAVRAALERTGAGRPLVRQQAAAAGETASLLRLLLSNGRDLPRHPHLPRPDQHQGLRPTGVMK